MDAVWGFLQAHRAWSITAGAGVLALVTIGGAALSSDAPTRAVAVKGIVAGDVINVEADGKEWVVSLLNLDTPQDCLTEEAAAYLESLLPAGTQVELENGQEKLDAQGRELAGVFLDGMLVNAEVAREGLGAAVVDGTDETFYDEVLQAQKEAEEAGKGLYSAETACTVPGQVQAYVAAAAHVESARQLAVSSEDLVEIDGYAAEAAAAALLGAALRDVLDGDRSVLPLASFDDAQVWNMLGDAGDADATVQDVKAVIATRRGEVEQLLAERAEAERLSQEEAARQAAAEAAAAAEAQRLAAEEAARQAAAAASSSGSSGTGGSGSSGGSAYYSNCSAARAAGAAPLYAGDPGYRSGLDRDRDGVACE